MAQVTEPGEFHTASSAHLEGIDFAGKTGTAEVVGHDAQGHELKGEQFVPNVWFVGVTPRRNPELVVAVLWQHGGFSGYPARIGAQVVSAYVEKQRRLAHNLVPQKAAAPVEMGAVWTAPETEGKGNNQRGDGARIQAGTFFVKDGQIVAPAKAGAPSAARRSATKSGQEVARLAGAHARGFREPIPILNWQALSLSAIIIPTLVRKSASPRPMWSYSTASSRSPGRSPWSCGRPTSPPRSRGFSSATRVEEFKTIPAFVSSNWPDRPRRRSAVGPANLPN